MAAPQALGAEVSHLQLLSASRVRFPWSPAGGWGACSVQLGCFGALLGPLALPCPASPAPTPAPTGRHLPICPETPVRTNKDMCALSSRGECSDRCFHWRRSAACSSLALWPQANPAPLWASVSPSVIRAPRVQMPGPAIPPLLSGLCSRPPTHRDPAPHRPLILPVVRALPAGTHLPPILCHWGRCTVGIPRGPGPRPPPSHWCNLGQGGGLLLDPQPGLPGTAALRRGQGICQPAAMWGQEGGPQEARDQGIGVGGERGLLEVSLRSLEEPPWVVCACRVAGAGGSSRRQKAGSCPLWDVTVHPVLPESGQQVGAGRPGRGGIQEDSRIPAQMHRLGRGWTSCPWGSRGFLPTWPSAAVLLSLYPGRPLGPQSNQFSRLSLRLCRGRVGRPIIPSEREQSR